MIPSVTFYVLVLVFILLWRAIGRHLRSHFITTTTVINDLPCLGKPRPDDRRVKGAAVICGGSIAGLWAARICADHFEEVVIVEPEALLATEDGITNRFDEKGNQIEGRGLLKRSHVPQFHAPHVFQPVALSALRRLFPNFDDEVKRADGRISFADLKSHQDGEYLMPPTMVYPDASFSQVFWITREGYERILRRLVLGYSERIRWVVGTATSLTPDENDSASIKSVTVRTESRNENFIHASLVVDCSGASQAGFRWLKRIFSDPSIQHHATVPKDALSFDADLKIEYNPFPHYRKFRVYVPPEKRPLLPIPGGYDNAGWIYAHAPLLGRDNRLFAMARMEGHRIEMGLGGWGHPPLPETLEDIEGWLRDLGPEANIPQWIFELVDMLLEIKGDYESDVCSIQHCSWIRYERAPYIPSNFVAIGDAVMRVNPTFGQGCSKAAIGAIVLDSILRDRSMEDSRFIPAGFGRAFFKKQKSKTNIFWSSTKPMDYQFVTTIPVKGEKLSNAWLLGKISSLLALLSAKDDEVSSVVWHVRALLAPETDLMHPRILVKILLLFIRNQFGCK